MTISTTQPLTSTRNGQHLLSLAGLLVLVAGTAYGDPSTTPEGQAAARRILNAILAAATAHGFGKADILRTMLDSGERGQRIHAIAREAVGAMPTAAFMNALQQGGFNVKGA